MLGYWSVTSVPATTISGNFGRLLGGEVPLRSTGATVVITLMNGPHIN